MGFGADRPDAITDLAYSLAKYWRASPDDMLACPLDRLLEHYMQAIRLSDRGA